MRYGNVISGCFPDVRAELGRAKAQDPREETRARVSDEKQPANSASRPIPDEAARPPASPPPRMFLQDCA